jgi:hypothetical protein
VESGVNKSENAGAATVRVALPYHLRNLARIEGDVLLAVTAPVTLRAVLDALEARYPMLRGTIRVARRGATRSGCNGERAATDHRRHCRRVKGRGIGSSQ